MQNLQKNPIEAGVIATFARSIENWYYSDNAADTWPLNEVVYAAAGVLKECAQGLEGGNFSPEYIREKCTTMIRSSQQALEVKRS